MSTVIASYRNEKERLPMNTGIGKTLYSSRPRLVDANPYVTVSDFVVPKQDISTFKKEETHIILNEGEIDNGSAVGCKRQKQYLLQPSKTGYRGPGWQMSIVGACGELATAKYLGIYYTPVIDIRSTKLSVGQLNIRTSMMAIPTLVLRQQDLVNNLPFILVSAIEEPNYYLTGWTFVKDVMKDHYFRQTPGKPGVYMIPFYDLEPIDKLPDDFLEEDDTSEEFNHNN